MGHQESEMKACYKGERGLSLDTNFKAGPQPFVLSQHHAAGPSQKVVASTQNKAMSGRPFYVRDKGLLKLNDIYLSSSQKAYRSFKKYVIFYSTHRCTWAYIFDSGVTDGVRGANLPAWQAGCKNQAPLSLLYISVLVLFWFSVCCCFFAFFRVFSSDLGF